MLEKASSKRPAQASRLLSATLTAVAILALVSAKDISNARPSRDLVRYFSFHTQSDISVAEYERTSGTLPEVRTIEVEFRSDYLESRGHGRGRWRVAVQGVTVRREASELARSDRFGKHRPAPLGQPR